MRTYLFVVALCVACIGGSVYGALVPFGSYTLTFERTGWTQSAVIDALPFPTSDQFYQVGGVDVDVYLQDLSGWYPGHGVDLEYTWYVNAPAVRDDFGTNELLGGTGPLTIKVENMKFIDTATQQVYDSDADLKFVPLVTHIYYVGFNGGEYVAMDLPGMIPVSPGVAQKQRSPVAPLPISDPDYPGYGTPYQLPGPGISFVLPDMYVPDVPNISLWELSFGAGFTHVPEPSIMLLLTLGAGMVFRRK